MVDKFLSFYLLLFGFLLFQLGMLIGMSMLVEGYFREYKIKALWVYCGVQN